MIHPIHLPIRSALGAPAQWPAVTALLAVIFAFINPLAFAGGAPATEPAMMGAAMRDGVSAIALPGIPGPLCVYGPDAFTVIAATSDDVPAPLVAASKLGKGRVVAFGHEGYFGAEALRTADTAKLVSSAILWAGDNLPLIKKRQTSVATHRLHDLEPVLKQMATDAVVALDGDDFATHLQNFDVLVIAASAIKPDDVGPLRQFLSRGGGIVAGVPGWGWLQTHPGKTLSEDFAANRLFADAGIAWADGEIDTPDNRIVNVSQSSPSALLNSSQALTALEQHSKSADALDAKEVSLAVRQVLRCVNGVSSGDTLILPKLVELQRSWPVQTPSAEHPMTDAAGISKVAYALRTRATLRQEPEQVVVAPESDQFPGKIPGYAARISRDIEIDTSVPGWHSTGLYAPPGQVVNITLASSASDAAAKPLKARIGAHSDRLWHLKEWKRAPQIDRTFPLDSPETRIASPFGGLVYIVVPDRAPRQTLRVHLESVIEAPYFILGKTDPADWRDRIRNAPAPWAELQSEKVIITIPSEHVRKLDDPSELMKFWDRVADADADLATIPRQRKRPERYVADVQISAGYMHAGYPIMTHLDAAPRFVDLPTLQREGDWGMFHEIGHNHQNPDWTFEGTGEVTVNLFTMYVLDTVCTGSDGRGAGKMHKAMSAESRAKMESKFRANGAKFQDWKRDPFLALIMYKQLQEGFGWDAYKKVFAEYRALKPEDRPKSDDQKRDQWMVLFSRTVGRNLGPFFRDWSIPVSEAALKSIDDLPPWMPPSTQPTAR